MKKLVGSLLVFFFPLFAFAADNSLSFTPPPGDSSVVFLGNIFGVVDGVLHGTGSQIMGQMFGIFNSAVLALGGIVIMYTLLVSTMNTANEGQMLGQKWNSMWVPLRAILGLSLLIPKASGYCVIQVFVMWVVVQGIGAADKVWSAALSYLNRGGVIVQAQMNPMEILLGTNTSVSNGAATITAGQTCMVAMQAILTQKRQAYLSYNGNAGPCNGTLDNDDPMKPFCDTPVPNFTSSVNAVAFQNDNPPSAAGVYTLPMPNFDSTSPYSFLNGSCGTISWLSLAASTQAANSANGGKGTISAMDSSQGFSASEQQTVEMTRAIAVQQLYNDLLAITEPAVSNDSLINPPVNSDDTPVTAVEQYGIPYMTTGVPCPLSTPEAANTWSANQQAAQAADPLKYAATCASWGPDQQDSKKSTLFNGTEFRNAITDYTAIMQPTLNLIAQNQNLKSSKNIKDFINQANSRGWMLAGSYYFNLAAVSSPVTNQDTSGVTAKNATSSSQSDTYSGLDSSTFSTATLTSAFNNNACVKGNKLEQLCQWLNADESLINNILLLIGGPSTPTTPSLNVPNFSSGVPPIATGTYASTINGYIGNSANLDLPGQPGLTPPTFGVKLPTPTFPRLDLPDLDFSCGDGRVLGVCLPKIIGAVIYDAIIKNLWNWTSGLILKFMTEIIQLFVFFPMAGMLMIFNNGLDFINQPNVNPIVGLANMGVYFINFCNQLWLYITIVSAILMAIPIVDLIVGIVAALIGPILLAWSAVMMGIGVICAYYIPFVPYMIFTFASIAWLMAVIEAMVAAPIVALGVTHPEGEGPLGKGEQAIMILMNVFLRPSMMIIGYISGIILSYVSVWVVNAGFSNVLMFLQGDPQKITSSAMYSTSATTQNVQNSMNSGYLSWAGLYSSFFSVILYVAVYLIVVQRSFTLITILPDKVLRWIGGQPETYGQDSSQWSDEAKQKVEKGGESAEKAMGQSSEKTAQKAAEGIKAIQKGMGPRSASMSDGGESKPKKND